MRVCVCMRMHVHVHVHVCSCARVCVCVCVCVCARACVSLCVRPIYVIVEAKVNIQRGVVGNSLHPFERPLKSHVQEGMCGHAGVQSR